MNKFVKIIWTVTSYAPLMIVCGIALFVDSVTNKQIFDKYWIGLVVIVVGIFCIILCRFIIYFASTRLAKSKLQVQAASSKDTNSLSSMIAYIFPVATLSISYVNLWALLAMVIIIIAMLYWSKAIFINPIVYIFGYRYYEVQTPSGMSYTLISKQKRFNPKSVSAVIELFDEMYLEVI